MQRNEDQLQSLRTKNKKKWRKLYFSNSVLFDCCICFFSRIFLFLHFLHVLNVLRKSIMGEEGVHIVDYLK